MNKIVKYLKESYRDKNFLMVIHLTENAVSKILSLALIIVIFASLIDLIFILSRDLFVDGGFGFVRNGLIEIFGLFLNILIALELLENIIVYLRKHVVQLELVLTTALIAVARKIIIFDPKQYEKIDLIALGIAIICLSASYWLIRNSHKTEDE